MENIREGENENIDNDTRARAMASVAGLGKPVAAPSKGGPVAASVKPSAGATAAPSEGVKPVAAGTLTKPAIVTLQQLNAFKAKYGADKDLTDYMNAEAGGLKRRNKVDFDLRNREADAAFARERDKAVAELTADEIANKQRKEKLARLKIASAGAESKMRQANALNMSRANFVRDAELRGKTPSDLKQDAPEPETRTPKRAGNLTDMLGLSNRYAKGGAVSASRRGDGIAQRGKTRGRMC